MTNAHVTSNSKFTIQLMRTNSVAIPQYPTEKAKDPLVTTRLGGTSVKYKSCRNLFNEKARLEIPRQVGSKYRDGHLNVMISLCRFNEF
jgi:hypothetical protein